MIILPAIDILGGKCVRLLKGEYSSASQVADSALDTARYFAQCGAEYIHLVDLDGAKNGKPTNADLFLSISKEVNVPLELGGGIRDLDRVEYYLSNGISRVIIGSAAYKNPDFVKEACKKYGEKIAVGIDARNGYVSTEGWTEDSDTDYITFAKMMEDAGVGTIIFTDIDRDGTQSGCNLEQLGMLSRSVSCNITASGGVNDINDIIALRDMKLYGAITGKAIYSHSLDLKQAIEICKE